MNDVNLVAGLCSVNDCLRDRLFVDDDKRLYKQNTPCHLINVKNAQL